MARAEYIFETNSVNGGFLVDRRTDQIVGTTSRGVDRYFVNGETNPVTGVVTFDSATAAGIKAASGVGPRVTLLVKNQSTTQKTINFPTTATHVTATWRQGSGSAATGGALFIVAGAGGAVDSAAKLTAGGGRSTLLLGKSKRFALAGVATGRLDFLTASAETGASELLLEFDIAQPSILGAAVLTSALAMLAEDAAPYDESGAGNHMVFDAGLTAAAAAANAGYLTTGYSTSEAAGFSLSSAIFSTLNPDAGDSYLVRVTAAITPPAGVCGVFGQNTTGNGWKLFTWSDGRLALIVSTAAGGVLPYDSAPAGTLSSSTFTHLSVYVDGPSKKIYAWVGNVPIVLGQQYTGSMSQPPQKLRFAGDLDNRSVAGRWKDVRVVKTNGMSLSNVMDLVGYLNLISEE